MTGVAGTMSGRNRGGRPALLARWLWLVAAIIVTVVAVGGITRLTESGLSITEWKPVTGVLPPLNDAQWQAEFDAYKLIPQYTQVNGPAGMTLYDYKFIYFWEWFHRFLVRTGLGLAFVLPLGWFWMRGAIPAGFKPRLLGLLGLGMLQGMVGWWMVKSGLSGDADVKVSHFRLATHLLLALFTLTYATWTALDMQALAHGRAPSRFTRFGLLAMAALFLQLFLGALVAGLRAGHVANDWPLMMGRLVPDGIDWSQGSVHAVLHDPFLLHFLHRWWAWGVVAILIVLARRIRKDCRPVSIAIHSAFGVQIILGIATVMTGVALWLAVLHQLVGALVVMATVCGVHALGRPK
ncbi:MAG: COX15/CtaA family protein [Novosphingobium sp.]